MVLLPFSLLPLLTIQLVKIMTFSQPILAKRAGSECERIYILYLCVCDIAKLVTTSEMDEDYFHKIEQPQFLRSFRFQIIAYICHHLVPVP